MLGPCDHAAHPGSEWVRRYPNMTTEFRKAILPNELRSLVTFDRKTFRKYPADRFDREDWNEYEPWWMIVGGRKIGCCAFEHHVAFQDDLNQVNPRLNSSLYIASTGILPSRQGQGYGSLLKCWQTLYARHHGFTQMITNTRQSNKPMIRLNRKFGFQIVRITPNYYENPREPTVVMELRF